MKLTLINKSLIIVGLVSVLGVLAINEAEAALEQQRAYRSPSSQQSRFNNPHDGAQYRLVQHIPCAKQHMIDIGYNKQHCVTPNEYIERAQRNSPAMPSEYKAPEPFEFTPPKPRDTSHDPYPTVQFDESGHDHSEWVYPQ